MGLAEQIPAWKLVDPDRPSPREYIDLAHGLALFAGPSHDGRLTEVWLDDSHRGKTIAFDALPDEAKRHGLERARQQFVDAIAAIDRLTGVSP